MGRQQVGIVGDEHASHVKLDLALARRLEQVERLGRGRKQQHGVGIASFRAVVQRHRRLVEGIRDRFIGLRVVLGLELGFRPLPQRAGRIDLARLALFGNELDRKLDIVGIGADDALDLVRLEIFFRIILQMQNDLGAARNPPGVRLGSRRDLEAGAPRRRPGPDLARAGVAAGDGDAVRHHEGRIEPDAELADQAGAVLGFRKLRNEGPGAGARDGAEIVDQFLPVHADAAVGDRQRASRLVRGNADLRCGAVAEQFRFRDRLIAQLVAGVRRVRDQLAQEDVGLGIDRMHHQVQKFGNLGLERLGDGGGIGLSRH